MSCCACVDETQHHGEQHCERRTHPNGAAPAKSYTSFQLRQDLSARHSDRATVTKQGARARAISGWEVPREKCRGIAGRGALNRPFVLNAPGSRQDSSRLATQLPKITPKMSNITPKISRYKRGLFRRTNRHGMKPHACNRKAATTSTLTKRARPREHPQVTLVTRHVPRLANALFARVVLSLP